MLLQSLAGFARAVAQAEEPGHVLSDLAEQVCALTGAAGAGVALQEGDRLVSAVVSHPGMAELEALQERRQEGPCVEAARSGRPVTIGDLTRTDRWPHLAEPARAAGIRAVAAVPLKTDSTTLGAVTTYHPAPRRWTSADVRPAGVLSELAAGYLLLARQVEERRLLTAQLQEALDSRVVIEQAKGMVAVHRGVDVGEAFEVLRRHANNHGATIESAADAVVRLGLRP